MLSVIYLPSTYLDCSGDMIDGRMGLSLLAINLERILYRTLHRAMGLNLSGESERSDFGSRVRKVALKADITLLVL